MERCFACNKPIHRKEPLEVDTRDAQTVYVGAECYKRVVAAGEAGYQPPKGGPRLYPLGGFADWAGQVVPCRFCVSDDQDEPVGCEINPHGDGWTMFGRGRTAAKALEQAHKAWNEYDQHA